MQRQRPAAPTVRAAGRADPYELRGAGGRADHDRRYRKKWKDERKLDFTRGVAITSSIHPNEHTHIEPVRYGRGSNAMGAHDHLQVNHDTKLPKVLGHGCCTCLRHPNLFLRSLSNAAGPSGPSSAW